MPPQDSSGAPVAASRGAGRFARADLFAEAEFFALRLAEFSRPTWMPERVTAIAESLTDAAINVLIDNESVFGVRAAPFDDAAHEFPREMHEHTSMPPRRGGAT